MNETDESRIVAKVLAGLAQTKKDEPWLQKNWVAMTAFIGQIIVAVLLIGKMSSSIDQLQAQVAEMRSVMVQKETMESKFNAVQDSLNSIKDGLTQTNKRVEAIEERQYNNGRR